jgi:hypothetical protein
LNNQIEDKEDHDKNDISLQVVEELKDLVASGESRSQVTFGIFHTFINFLFVHQDSLEEMLKISNK